MSHRRTDGENEMNECKINKNYSKTIPNEMWQLDIRKQVSTHVDDRNPRQPESVQGSLAARRIALRLVSKFQVNQQILFKL